MSQDLIKPELQKHFTTWMQEAQFRQDNHPVFGYQNTEHLILANGVSLSIQAGGSHYCEPRKNLPYSQYQSFEVGFPSARIEELMPYCNDEEKPTKTIYTYVPMAVLEHYIVSAGGVVGTKKPQITGDN